MKLLMMYNEQFSYFPNKKNLEEFETIEDGKTFEKVLLAFIHAEEEDEENPKKVEDKLLKNIKWAAKKNETDTIILHSFAHLSESKASPDFTKQLFDKVDVRLKNADYKSFQTPFGYFLDLNIQAPGCSLARIFKSF